MKNILTFLIIFLVGFTAKSQNPLDKFWKSFKNNEYENSILELEKYTSENPNDEQGLALLTYMYDSEDYPYKAFQTFKKLYVVTLHKTEYLQAFWYTSALNHTSKASKAERLAFYNEVLQDENIDGSIKALIHESISNYYYAEGDFDAYREELGKIKSLNNWQVVGEFENISASGFNKSFGPFSHPESGSKFVNKRKAPVHWFKSSCFNVGDWIRFDYHFSITNAINYAQTFVHSEMDQDVELRVGVSGSVKAWVNDQLLIAVEEEYNNNVDSYRSKMSLKKGWNRILIQIGASELSSQNFKVRLTNEKGDPIGHIKHQSSYQEYPKIGGSDISIERLEAEKYFKTRVEEEPDNILYNLLLGRVLLDNGNTDEAHSVIVNLEKLAPKSGLIMWELIKLYSAEDNETDLGACIEKIKKEDPMNIFSLSYQFNEAIDNENYDEAKDLLEKIESVSRQEEDIYEKKITLESSKENNQKVIDLAKEAYTKFPENATFLKLKYYIELNVNQNVVYAQKF